MAQPDFVPEWIWGDDVETTVFAQGYGLGHTIIFSFTLRNKSKSLTSLAVRICNSFHALKPADEFATFPNSTAMRDTLWDAVRRVWPLCLKDPEISKLDAIVDIDSSDGTLEKICWKVYHHPLFPRYVKCLADPAIGKTEVRPGDKSVDFATLTRYEQLGGHGCATRVHLFGEATNNLHVFKGIDFRTFLTYSDDEGDVALRYMIRGWHNSNTLLRRMPPHPNILPPPSTLVTFRFPGDDTEPVVCGTLQPLYPGGDVGDRIEKCNKAGVRLTLELKAHWCANMAAAVAHTHRIARTYHMDIKPGNFLIDGNEDLVLCDWEQTDAPATTLAPEADGTWDVYEEEQGAGSRLTNMDAPSRRRLRYTKYTGPPRRNVDEDVLGDASWHVWNVFTVWVVEHPRALELAEVFSLGRSIWMLVRQPDMDFEEVAHPNDLVTDWDHTEDIPGIWKNMTERCMSQDPNERPDLLKVVRFWNNEWMHQRAKNAKMRR